MKHTPFYQRHVKAGAKIVDFAGWALPLQYTGILEEAQAVRTGCGLCDVSHMGDIRIEGVRAFNFLQRLTCNDISALQPGQLQYNLLLNEQAGVIDDLMIYRFNNSYLCVVNAINKNTVLQWLEKNNQEEADIIDETAVTALLSLQGPLAHEVLIKAVDQPQLIEELGYMHCVFTTIDQKSVRVSRSGYTGEDGFEIYSSFEDAVAIWDCIVNYGQPQGLILYGLGARDILRIEAGYPLYGHELAQNINPYQATVPWAVKLTKEFIGKDTLAFYRRQGIDRQRVGFVMQEKSMPRQGYRIFVHDNEIGTVCSGAYSPTLKKFIGMAFVDKEWTQESTEIEIEIRNRRYRASVQRFPFIPIRTKRNRCRVKES